MTIDPIEGALGPVDVTLGAPGLAAPAPPSRPSRSAISFGVQRLEKNGSYLILGNVSPQMLFGPRVAALPADLSKAPLPLWQGANETLSVPLRLDAGDFFAYDGAGAAVAVTLGPETTQDGARVATATIAPSGRARAVGLSFVARPGPPKDDKSEAKDSDEKPETSAKAPARPRAPLVAGADRPVFFDLARDETQELRFDAPEAGLYRVETLGRLKTAVKLGAAVAPNLGFGLDNGPGHNGVAANFLRAGAYRAAVTAKELSGRVGFSVSRAPLLETQKLAPGGVARAALNPAPARSFPWKSRKMVLTDWNFWALGAPFGRGSKTRRAGRCRRRAR